MTPDPYRTTDFYLAAYLRAAGYSFSVPEVDPRTRRATFVFQNVSPEDIVAYYNTSETHRVSALGMVASIRQTRELLFNLPS
jgi:hypothetical protein